MTTKVKCNFCSEKIDLHGQDTLPNHETSKGSGERCDGSGLPATSMDPNIETQEAVLTDGGTAGKDS